jgi:pyruvate/2-oxoglutarate dehydrogenase complex dihydrolipoamide acyltransferase (E2) component
LGGESASGTVPGVAAGSYPRPPGDDKRAYEHGIEGKLGATLMEVALPGPMGTAAGLTGDGIDCLKMGFDFVGALCQESGRRIRAEYDRQQAAQQAAKEQEARALQAAKQAEKARQAELAKQAAKQRAKKQAAKRAKQQAAKEQAAREQAAREQAAKEKAQKAAKEEAAKQQQQQQPEQQQQNQEPQQKQEQESPGSPQEQPDSGNGPGCRLPCQTSDGRSGEIGPDGQCFPWPG